MIKCQVALIVFSLVFLNFGSSIEIGPLVVWTKNMKNDNCNQEFTPSTLQTVNDVFNYNFVDCMVEQHAPKKVIMFLQEKLTLDQLRPLFSLKHPAEEIIYLRNLLESASSTIVPAFDLKGIDYEVKSRFKKLPFEVFTITEGLESAARDIRQKLDDEQGNVIAIWTTSINSEEEIVRHRRAVEQVSKSNQTCRNTECVIMCVEEVILKVGSSLPGNFALSDEAASGACKRSDGISYATFTQKFGKKKDSTGTVQEMTLTLEFSKQVYRGSGMSWWTVDNATVEYQHSNASSKAVFKKRALRSLNAPANWSLSCAKPPLVKAKGKKDNERVTIQFAGLQLEAFTVDGITFSSNNLDCVNWFSVPILLGILISLFLIFMLAYAYTMVASITTMDRFDDPKGKGIAVPQD